MNLNMPKMMALSALLLFLLGLSLGPYMVSVQSPKFSDARQEYGQSMAALKGAVEAMEMAGEEGHSDDVPAVAKGAADAVLAIGGIRKTEGIRGGARAGHAHSNLESLWTLAAALVLLQISVPLWLRNAIGACFIVGSWTHGAMFALGALGQTWAYSVAGLGAGPVLLILGAALLGYGVLTGWPGDKAAE